ncbi:MAG: RyR domain protein [Deltaproteobacteria bacterium]|nr:RyR domain protein [Deltaproteobacteria bacterium]MBM4286431.1 RyR domain protein [Deltaproteobacteria bacterium]
MTELKAFREKLGRAIHEKYLEAQRGKMPPDDPAMQPWETLREDLKESNRQQADQIPDKLQALGYTYKPAKGPRAAKFRFTPPEVETLAKMEHDRWMAEKRAAGWTYGPVKDAGKKTHPSLLPWEELPEEEKDKDRQAVRAIPALLAAAGFEIQRQRTK